MADSDSTTRREKLLGAAKQAAIREAKSKHIWDGQLTGCF
jgi:hypothetical protein